MCMKNNYIYLIWLKYYYTELTLVNPFLNLIDRVFFRIPLDYVQLCLVLSNDVCPALCF